MKIYVRKITLSKWILPTDRQEDILDDIKADACTSELRTSTDRLSFWEFEAEEYDINDHVLNIKPESLYNEIMLTLGLSGQKFVTVNCVVLDETEVQGYDKDPNNEGNTKYLQGINNHKNFKELRFNNIKDLTLLISNKINDKNYISFSKRELIDCTINFLTLGDININDLKIIEDVQRFDGDGQHVIDYGDYYDEVIKNIHYRIDNSDKEYDEEYISRLKYIIGYN